MQLIKITVSIVLLTALIWALFLGAQLSHISEIIRNPIHHVNNEKQCKPCTKCEICPKPVKPMIKECPPIKKIPKCECNNKEKRKKKKKKKKKDKKSEIKLKSTDTKKLYDDYELTVLERRADTMQNSFVELFKRGLVKFPCEPEDIKGSTAHLKEFTAVVMIFHYDSPKSRYYRDTIRNTFMKYSNVYHEKRNPNGTILIRFGVGGKSKLSDDLYKERDEHGDIALVDAEDGKFGEGKMHAMFTYMWKHFKFQWGARMDDDSFLHTERFEKFLNDQKQKHLVHLGSGGPLKNVRVPHHFFREVFVMVGLCIVLSADMVAYLNLAKLPKTLTHIHDHHSDVLTGYWLGYGNIPVKIVTTPLMSPGAHWAYWKHPHPDEQMVVHYHLAKVNMEKLHNALWNAFPRKGHDPRPIVDGKRVYNFTEFDIHQAPYCRPGNPFKWCKELQARYGIKEVERPMWTDWKKKNPDCKSSYCKE